MNLREMHASNVAEVNARTASEGRCVMHNTDVFEPASVLVELPIGNVIALCPPCWAWWQADEDNSQDPMSKPVRVTEIDR